MDIKVTTHPNSGVFLQSPPCPVHPCHTLPQDPGAMGHPHAAAELPVPLAFPTCTAVCSAQFYQSETPCCTGHCHVQLTLLIAVSTSNFVVDSKGKNTAEQVC